MQSITGKQHTPTHVLQALIQYPDPVSANNAKNALEGHAIYDGGYNRVSGHSYGWLAHHSVSRGSFYYVSVAINHSNICSTCQPKLGSLVLYLMQNMALINFAPCMPSACSLTTNKHQYDRFAGMYTLDF